MILDTQDAVKEYVGMKTEMKASTMRGLRRGVALLETPPPRAPGVTAKV